MRTARGSNSPKRPDKREAILGAALELFAERGFDGTAVLLVAERAEVGAGTIYRYFDSKEALVNAVFRHWKVLLGESMLRDFPSSAPMRQQFHVFWRRLAAFAAEHPKALMFLELHHHAPYLDRASVQLTNQMTGAFLGFLKEMEQQEVLKALPHEVMMNIVFGAFFGLLRASWQGRLALTESVLDAGERCCWEAIRR